MAIDYGYIIVPQWVVDTMREAIEESHVGLWFWFDKYGMTPELCAMIGLLSASETPVRF